MTPEQRKIIVSFADGTSDAYLLSRERHACSAALDDLDAKDAELALLRLVAADDQPDDTRIHAQMEWRAKYGDRP
jgi:hypothetical protein